MKVALTGHTGTIGKYISASLIKAGHEVIGFSRSNGFDLHESKAVMRAVEAIIPCDLFVNCAHVGYQQALLTHHVSQAWKKSPNKRIIVFSSTAVHAMRPEYPFYTAEKMAVEKMAMSVHNTQEYPRISIIRFGTVDIPERPTLKDPKMKPEDLVKTFEFVLSQSATCDVFQITIAPPLLRFNMT